VSAPTVNVWGYAPWGYIAWGGSDGILTEVFEEALVSKLGSISELTALTSGMFTQSLPETWQLDSNGPALSYVVTTKPYGHVLSGSDGTATARVSFNIWSYEYGTAKQITEAIFNAIDGQPDIWGNGSVEIMSVVQQDEIDASEPPQAGTDQWVYRLIVEYNVKYRVSLPALV
jgi:hypothetical protein